MSRSDRHPIARVLVFLFCITLVLFPKGGIRVAGLPITWGYALLFLSVPVLLVYRMISVQARYVSRQIVALLSLVPFWLVFFYAYFAYGLQDSYSRAGFVSTLTSLVFMPLLFLWFFPPMMPLVDRELLIKLLRFCILAAAIFGIFQFFWRPIVGSFLQVPYITMNADDSTDFAATKNIQRGYFFKLISTYNNGNLYGVATFTVLRLFDEIAPKRWQRWIMRVALFLTLSRTIWAGLIFDQMLSLLALLFEQRHRFPRLKLGKKGATIAAAAACIPLFIVMVSFLGLRDGAAFILDPTLGGRTSQFVALGGAPFFPNFPSVFMFTEIVYLSAINLYGYIGIVVISCILLSPLAVLAFDHTALNDRFRRAALKGLLLYACICTSDGALNYIPVMAFYWFIYAVFLFGLPGPDMAYPVASSRDQTRSTPMEKAASSLPTPA